MEDTPLPATPPTAASATRVPFYNLPVELVSQVFESLIYPISSFRSHFRHLILISSIDTKFRNLALSNPKLWSLVRLKNCKNALEVAELCLMRSQTCPVVVRLEVDMEREYIDRCTSFLSAVSPRLLALSALATGSLEEEELVKMLGATPMPALEILNVETNAVFFERDTPLDLTLPALKWLTLNGHGEMLSIASIAGVKRLYLAGDSRSQPWANINELLAMLDALPELEDLGLDGIRVSARREAVPADAEEATSIQCSSLRSLLVKDVVGVVAGDVLCRVVAPNLELLRVSPPQLSSVTQPINWKTEKIQRRAKVKRLHLISASGSERHDGYDAFVEAFVDQVVGSVPNAERLVLEGKGDRFLTYWTNRYKSKEGPMPWANLKHLLIVDGPNGNCGLTEIYGFLVARLGCGHGRLGVTVGDRMPPEVVPGPTTVRGIQVKLLGLSV